MPALSAEIIQLVSTFSIAFTVPTFRKAVTLLCGTILAPGRRTVAAALRVVGLAADKHFTNYHRVLNRDRWWPWILSKLLLALIIGVFISADAPLILLIDETIERRRGDKIQYKGWFRDPVRSTGRYLNKVLGIRWMCVCLLVPVPWSPRPWALPFMSVPALSKATSTQLNKRQRTIVEWAALLMGKVRRWQPDREMILVGDGTYAALSLIRCCQSFDPPVTFVSRLRWDAALHDFPEQRSQSGPKPKKGNRQPNPGARLKDPGTPWQALTLPWYAGQEKVVQFVTGVSLWAKRGEAPAPIRWVLVRCPQDRHFKPEAFYCSDASRSSAQILAWVIARWNIEVTFEELRTHLGFETQRQWSKRAIEHTTPCLFGIFSLVVLMAKVLYPHTLPVRTASWYPKQEASFSDALAAVRYHLWKASDYSMSPKLPDMLLIHQYTLDSLLELACYSA
jgi:hypothetical protein